MTFRLNDRLAPKWLVPGSWLPASHQTRTEAALEQPWSTQDRRFSEEKL